MIMSQQVREYKKLLVMKSFIVCLIMGVYLSVLSMNKMMAQFLIQNLLVVF